MNRCGYKHQQQNAALVGLGCVGEMRAEAFSSFSMGMMAADSNGVVCPKPRRLVNVNDSISFRPSRLLHANNQPLEAGESKAGTELLDIILTKGDYGAEKPNFQVASSPPFFSGSPPVRASNPLIQDEQFGNSKLSPLSPSFAAMDSPSSSRKSNNGGGAGGGGGGCVRMKFGHNPAPVRIEGFNCRRNCSISAVA
ncbi:hypothetical protein M9H77_28989 [Catharanthus roseus]|uniref:Uncharacterized protein n=1 Tax=Catharanthus roseus TaxID=4058 RepID=A0ACC0AL32_CATRO|nr:hypothetical protein M9H77_28989 [Catharanthus roseus]